MQPVREDEHGPELKGVEVPLIAEDRSAEDRSAVLDAAEVIEHLECFDSAKDAA